MKDIPVEMSVSLYPVPVSDILNVEILNAGEKANLRVFNMNGQIVRSISIEKPNGTFQLNMSDQTAGMYTIQIITDNGVVNKNIIVR